MSTIGRELSSHSVEESGQLLFWLQQAHQAMKLHITRAFKMAGANVSTEQFSVLSYVHKQGRVTQTDIARATRRERASITRILFAMEREGWVKRSTLDRRTNRVELTERGLELYRLLVPVNDQMAAETLADCTQPDIEAGIRLLKKLASTRTR